MNVNPLDLMPGNGRINTAKAYTGWIVTVRTTWNATYTGRLLDVAAEAGTLPYDQGHLLIRTGPTTENIISVDLNNITSFAATKAEPLYADPRAALRLATALVGHWKQTTHQGTRVMPEEETRYAEGLAFALGLALRWQPEAETPRQRLALTILRAKEMLEETQ